MEMLQERVRELEAEAEAKEQQLATAEQQLQQQGEQLRWACMHGHLHTLTSPETAGVLLFGFHASQEPHLYRRVARGALCCGPPSWPGMHVV